MNILPHPATRQLLRLQSAGAFYRTLRRFRQPRRLVLSTLALLLAIVWVSQTGLAMFLREPADPDKLRAWIPLGLLAYALWHVLKAACRGPIEPFEWTPAEVELLGGAPLRRRDLVDYRLMGISTASVGKATCFCLVMAPDIHFWMASFTGVLLALIFVDLLRMAIEIVVYGLSRREFRCFRWAVLLVAGTAMTGALASSLSAPTPLGANGLPVVLDLGLRCLARLADFRTTWVGGVLVLPFRPYASVILASGFSLSIIGLLMLNAMMVLVASQVTVWLDHYFHARRVAGERQQYRRLESKSTEACESVLRQGKSMRIPARLWGAGGLAWRQTLGVVRHRTSLLISLALPAILCCLTLLQPQEALSTLLQVVGGVIFYSFILLPTSLKFDFRRDLDRLDAIKVLPISPLAATVGQLVTPVVVTTFFQVAVLTVTAIARPLHFAWYPAVVISLVPVNVLIFATENLIFMLYPYRPGQEGIAVFLRSILTFTAKGIAFAVALALTMAGAFASKHVAAHVVAEDVGTTATVIFLMGMWLLCTTFAVLATIMLVRVYRRFDPSEDMPALS